MIGLQGNPTIKNGGGARARRSSNTSLRFSDLRKPDIPAAPQPRHISPKFFDGITRPTLDKRWNFVPRNLLPNEKNDQGRRQTADAITLAKNPHLVQDRTPDGPKGGASGKGVKVKAYSIFAMMKLQPNNGRPPELTGWGGRANVEDLML